MPVLPPIGGIETPPMPVMPELPKPIEAIVPVAPSVAPPAVPSGLAMPELPAAPTVTLPTLPGDDKPADPETQWPRLPGSVEKLPAPKPVVPVMPAPLKVEPEPVALPAQPVQIPAMPSPVAPIVPVTPEIPLPPSQPGFNVNTVPVAPPMRQAPGVLSSLAHEPPGDAPAVIPTLQTLKSAVAGVALAATPLSAVEPPAKIPPATTDAAQPDLVANLRKEIEKLREDARLEKKFREAIDDMVRGTQDNESGTKIRPAWPKKFNKLETRMTALENKFAAFDAAKFEATLKSIESKLNDLKTTGSVALKPETKSETKDSAPTPMPGPKPAFLDARASVRIVNEFPVPISLKVNEVAYRVEPNDSKLVEVPAGTYSYELLNTDSPVVVRTLKENQSETLRIK